MSFTANVQNLSFEAFREKLESLKQFGSPGFEHLVIEEGTLSVKEKAYSIWQFPFYKPPNERVAVVADFALEFFSRHAAYLQDKIDFLQKFKPVFINAGCPEKFALLMERVHAYRPIHAALHPDILPGILRYLPGNDIARSREVSRLFFETVEREDFLSRKVLQAKLLRGAAAMIEANDSRILTTHGLRTLLQILPKQREIGDMRGVLATLEKAKGFAVKVNQRGGSYFHLPEFAAEYAKVDIAAAFEFAGGVRNPSQKDRVYSEVIVQQSVRDLDAAIDSLDKIAGDSEKESCLSLIYKEQLKLHGETAFQADFTLAAQWAVDMVNRIEDVQYRFDLLSEAVTLMARHDPDATLAFIEQQESPHWENAKYRVGLEIVKSDVERAESILNETLSDAARNKLAVAVIAEKAKQDVIQLLDEGIESVTSGIQGYRFKYYRSLAWAHIAVRQTQSYLVCSRQTFQRALSLCEESEKKKVLSLWGSVDWRGALEEKNRIDWLRYHAWLKEVLPFMAKEDLKGALALADQIDHPINRAETIAYIAMVI